MVLQINPQPQNLPDVHNSSEALKQVNSNNNTLKQKDTLQDAREKRNTK